MRVPINELPWPFAFGLVGFVIVFLLQFRLKYHVDREKVLQLEDMSELYPMGRPGVPPRKILTERGQRLLFWFYFGFGLFLASIVLFLVLYGT